MQRIAALAIASILIGLGFSLYAGHQLVAPALRTIGEPPENLEAKTVHFTSESGSTIAGWLTEQPNAVGSVLLLHAVRADRRSMVGRARFLGAAGYSTLCIDLQAHGESPGQHITMGYLEAMDAAAAVAFLRERFPNRLVAVLGTSLGGAAALMAKYDSPPDALIVESVFADVETAIRNRMRMRFGGTAPLLAPLLICQIEPRLGIGPDRLRPVHAIANVRCPIFILCGSTDQHATPAESQALFSAASEPREFWQVIGAAHVDLHRFAGHEYERRIIEFLARLNRAQSRPQ
ncbi:MAG: alpha/beta hydrolase [Verrucomicrobiae bacterium]|nr:alpha/beta hydrolase [Verrucomicrobiae bacterium]